MKLGYSITSNRAGITPEEAATAVLDRAQAAREAGFDYVQAGDHHLVGPAASEETRLYLQNVPTAARLSATFDHVAAMVLLPLYHPVLVAEQLGTLAAFADTFDFWCALGHQERSFEAFGVPIEERAPRFEEGLALIRRLWTEDGVTVDGEFYAVEDASVNPKADPRVCIGASAEPAVRRAGRLGDAWVASPTESLDDLRRKGEWFVEAGGGDLLARREALVLEDGTRARELADDLLATGYRGWPSDAGWIIAGDAGDAVAELERLAGRGVDEVIVRPMSDQHAVETLRELGRARGRL